MSAPVPTSSSSTSERLPLSARSAEMRRRWPLKVERLALRLCSSPAARQIGGGNKPWCLVMQCSRFPTAAARLLML